MRLLKNFCQIQAWIIYVYVTACAAETITVSRQAGIHSTLERVNKLRFRTIN